MRTFSRAGDPRKRRSSDLQRFKYTRGLGWLPPARFEALADLPADRPLVIGHPG
jgi:hypothetical protein